MTLFDSIRAAAAEVAEGARHLRVRHDRIAAYAASLPLSTAPTALDPALHYVEPERDPEGTAAFVLTLDSVNFGSGWFPAVFGPQASGYAEVAGALAGRFRTGGAPTAAALARLDGAGAAALTGLDPRNPDARALADLFARALNDLGRLVEAEHDGRFLGLVEAAGGSAEALVQSLRRMPLFEDVADWRGRRVPFLKRAQIAVADLALAFGGRGPGRFADAGALTIFADNLVPHVLRHDGVLDHSPDLAARIDRGEPIPPGSEEEVEIRAAAIHAVELMRAALGGAVTSVQLDHILWNRGEGGGYRRWPRHATRTVFY